MRKAFADTSYWIAVSSPRDERHAEAEGVTEEIESSGGIIFTTDEVLSEFLTFFSSGSAGKRQATVALVEEILAREEVRVVHQTHESFLAGVNLYKRRPDKGYSMVDCASMECMKKEGIIEALSFDKHFAQEGFRLLFR